MELRFRLRLRPRHRAQYNTLGERIAVCGCFETALFVCTFWYLSLLKRLFLSTASRHTRSCSRTLAHTHTNSGRGKATRIHSKETAHLGLRAQILLRNLVFCCCIYLFFFWLYLSDAQGKQSNNKYCVIFVYLWLDTLFFLSAF